MKMNGLTPTTRAVNTCIYMCAYKQDFYSKGFEIFTWMIDNGLKPDEHTLSSLLVCCAKNADVPNAMRLAKQFIHTYGMVLNRSHYTHIIDAISESQIEPEIQLDNGKASRRDRINLAEALFADMIQTGIDPDVR